MKRKFKIINYLVTFLTTVALACFTIFCCGQRYSVSLKDIILPYVLGLLIAGFLCALFHELGHLVFGKANGFALMSFSVWFLNWQKQGEKFKFGFSFNTEEAGSTEMVKKQNFDMEKGLRKMTLGGLIFSFLSMLIGLVAIFVNMPYFVYCLVSVFLPVGAYFFFGNVIPSSEYSVRNDGAVLYGLRKKDDETKVLLSILAVQSELYNGKTFSEIDDKFYFDVPQLPEDSVYFIMLLNYRYNFYLDKGDYEQAKRVTDRLLSLEEYMPKSFIVPIKMDALYNFCTFNFNANKADEIMYEIEGPINKLNVATATRVKLAYILYVKKEKRYIEAFYNKGKKEANRSQLKGLKLFERKLLDQIKKDFSK